jgi:hypothetical protein
MVIDRESNFVPIPVELRRFLGVIFQNTAFWGLAGVGLLFLSSFKKNNILPNTLPDLRPDPESWANFGLEQTFTIFKNLQTHILLLVESIKATVDIQACRLGTVFRNLLVFSGADTSCLN